MASSQPSKQRKKSPLLNRKQYHSPTLSTKDPSLPLSLPASSKDKKIERIEIDKAPRLPLRKRCCKFCYDKENKTFCGRTCESWFYIIAYSIMYLLFLCTYTVVLLYISLCILKKTTDFKDTNTLLLLTSSEHGVGLSATPTFENSQPLIWYRKDRSEDYKKYINALDNLLVKKRRKRDVDKLGACSRPPYGYGDKPCIVIKINRHFRWSGKPIEENSEEASNAPLDVQKWLKQDKKLWLHCDGYHSYDKEHVGKIRYFPDPPGIDPGIFPLGVDDESPIVAIQISDYTLGVSLAIQCNLWYANGPSSVEFVLYVPDDRTVSNRSNV